MTFVSLDEVPTVLANGECGDNAIWSLDSQGLLSISGNGSTYTYSTNNKAPWYDYRANIQSVEVEEGITGLGNHAFYMHSSITNISLPSTLETIGDSVFRGCSGLTEISIPESVTKIGGYAFSTCNHLQSITIPDSVVSLGTSAFYNCKALNEIVIGSGINTISGYVFYGCTALEEITIPSTINYINSSAFNNCSSLTTVKGYNGTVAESFASANNLTFVSLDEESDLFTIIFNAGEGKFSDGSSTTSVEVIGTFNVVEGISEAPIYANHEFLGWALASNASRDNIITELEVTADTTLYAVYEELYTVTYNAGEGAFLNGEKTIIETGQGTYTLISEKPTLDGMVFDGWFMNNQPVGPEIVLTDDVILTAQYLPIPVIEYTVYYDTEGGNEENWSEIAECVGSGITYYNITAMVPTKDGFTFLGWSLDGQLVSGQIELYGDVTLTAQWEEVAPVTYTVIYDANGGQFADGSNTRTDTTFEGNYPLSGEEPTKEGYDFSGWLVNGEVATEINVTSDITVTAFWTEHKKDIIPDEDETEIDTGD